MSRGEPLYRQWNILKALQANHFGLTLDELAQRLACSRRQVQRDLKVLQEVGFPVRFEVRDGGKRFWRNEWRQIESDRLLLSMTETISLFLSQQLLAPLAGTQFGDGLATAIDKIKAFLPAKALGYFQDLSSLLVVKSLARHDYSAQDKEIRIINQAISDTKVLRIHYHSASQGTDLETTFHPYGMVFLGTNLYCIGFMPQYDEIRTLKVSRFKGVEMTGKSFERPLDFSLSAHVQGGFGIISDGRPQRLKVRFTGWAATNVREHVWHPSQKVVKNSYGRLKGDRDDSVTATFDLNATAEFKRWLLGFGRNAVVLAPRSLAAEIKEEFRHACGAYGVSCKAPAQA